MVYLINEARCMKVWMLLLFYANDKIIMAADENEMVYMVKRLTHTQSCDTNGNE